MINNDTIIQNRILVLKTIYKLAEGKLDKRIKELLIEIKLKEKIEESEVRETLSYLHLSNYLLQDRFSRNELQTNQERSFNYKLTPLGLDEVLKDFPTLNSKPIITSNIDELFEAIFDGHDDIKTQLQSIQIMEEKMTELNINIILIKEMLDKMQHETQDDELKSIILETLTSSSVTSFLANFYRLINHDKSKEMLGKFKGKILPQHHGSSNLLLESNDEIEKELEGA